MSLDWRGPQVVARMRKATRIGINQTMAAGVAMAKQNHTWKNRTGTAERSIRIATPAQTGPDGKTIGIWGSTAVKYFWGLEFGTKARTIVAKAGGLLRFKGRDGRFVFVRSVRHPGTQARPVLNPTAQKVYRFLPGFIQRAWGSLG